jgi:hypothetical protein
MYTVGCTWGMNMRGWLVDLKNVLSLDAVFEELPNMAPAYNHF